MIRGGQTLLSLHQMFMSTKLCVGSYGSESSNHPQPSIKDQLAGRSVGNLDTAVDEGMAEVKGETDCF